MATPFFRWNRSPAPGYMATSSTGRLFRSQAMLGLGDGPRGIDQTDVAEGLREVPQQLARCFVHLFGQEADVVGEGGGALEGDPGSLDLTGQGQRLGQPEGAQKERPFGSLQAIFRAVPEDQAVVVGQPI